MSRKWLQKFNKLVFETLPHLAYCLRPIAIFSERLYNSLQIKIFSDQVVAENDFKKFISSKILEFYGTSWMNIFIVGKNAQIFMILIWILKSYSKLRYTPLKLARKIPIILTQT